MNILWVMSYDSLLVRGITYKCVHWMCSNTLLICIGTENILLFRYFSCYCSEVLDLTLFKQLYCRKTLVRVSMDGEREIATMNVHCFICTVYIIFCISVASQSCIKVCSDSLSSSRTGTGTQQVPNKCLLNECMSDYLSVLLSVRHHAKYSIYITSFNPQAFCDCYYYKFKKQTQTC